MRKFLFIISIVTLITVLGFIDPYASRIRPFPSGTVPISCAENSTGYSMTLHKFYICTNLGYTEIDMGGASSFAPIDATYITETTNTNLTNEFALASLATGILKNTTTTGIPSIAVAGTDYQVPITAGDVTTSGAISTIGNLKVTNGMLAGSIAYSKLSLTGAILNADLAGSIAYSKLTLTGSIVNGDIISLAWSKLTGTPTTLAGYGITDAESPLTFNSPLSRSVNTISCTTCALTSGNLSQFASTTSAQLKTLLSDENGTGVALFDSSTSATFITPILGIPTSVTLTNATGLPISTGVSGLASGAATFLGSATSSNLRALLSDETGSGSAVFATSPSLVTPNLGTPASGTVTNLTGTASININGTVGATTPNTGSFTTLIASGAITPSQTNGIVGTTTNNDANAGSVGEYIESSIPVASAITLTTVTSANVTSISLTAGDWDVWGQANFLTSATTTVTYMLAGSSTTSATITIDGTDPSVSAVNFNGLVTGNSFWYTVPFRKRIKLSGTTTVYLVVRGNFGISNMTACGIISARRVR